MSALLACDSQAIDELPDELLLHAHSLADEWNGWAVPVATAAEFRRYVSQWAANDRNGTWSPDGIVEGDGALIYGVAPWDESDRDVWSVVGRDESGAALYALAGWVWVTL
jgi:hypothetical protein